MSDVQVTYQDSAPSPYAGFWRRVGASTIDGLILSVPIILLMVVFWPRTYSVHEPAPFSIGFYLITGALVWAYRIYFESSAHMATPGKIALNIVVTDLEGDAITMETATKRNWVYWLTSVVAIIDIIFGSWNMAGGIGFFGIFASIAVITSCVMVAFTARKQGGHDMMAGCLVVRKGARFEQKSRPASSPTTEPSPSERFLNRWEQLPWTNSPS